MNDGDHDWTCSGVTDAGWKRWSCSDRRCDLEAITTDGDEPADDLKPSCPHEPDE